MTRRSRWLTPRRTSLTLTLTLTVTPMKLIVAIIRPEKLEDVQKALAERDVYLMTVSDVRGCGRQRGYTEVYRGTEVQIRLIPKLKLEIAVNEAFVEATVEAIVHAARTGETGHHRRRQDLRAADGRLRPHPHRRARRRRHRAVSTRRFTLRVSQKTAGGTSPWFPGTS